MLGFKRLRKKPEDILAQMKNSIFLFVLVMVGICLGLNGLVAGFSSKERAYYIEESILLKDLPRETKDLRIWIPYPVNDSWQSISDFKLVGSFDVGFITDKEYGNRIIYLTPKQSVLDEPRSRAPGRGENTSEIQLSFKVQRREYNAFFDSPISDKIFSRFLKPNRLVPVNGQIKVLARRITQEKKNDLERVRAIYDYIIDELTYSKDDPKVCGIGNSLLTLEFKKGICTDYHSLFISLVRSLGIPAKFEIGFPIPGDKEEGKINGYHCWAKFYLRNKGWIPVDISEADKHPEKRDYFFGHIDENRIHLTTGRDISLAYARDKDALPLNFFVYPYVELNGEQFDNVDIEVSFQDFERR